MTGEDYLKQQYLTLREEIRASKSRIFILMILGTLFIPAAGFAAREFSSTYASGSMPFIILVLMLDFIMEQNTIIRAGKYLKDHVEPHIDGIVTWESWLENNRTARDTDKYFFGSFLLIFVLFYAIASGLAVESLCLQWPEQKWYAVFAYSMGGLWFLLVLVRHWHACTSTK
jgi:hypothetical protein